MPDLRDFRLLAKIKEPSDFRHFSTAELKQLAREVRDFLLLTLNKTGGHLSSGLGVTELTIAIHAVFNTPQDKLIWDVGHQCYPHKMLTGRLEDIRKIRQKDGISGFPRRSESAYDSFGVGHSSTSISAALGMVLAQNANSSQKHIAVIGDGAMTAGMAFEAMNHAGDLKADLIVILNDNNMSISPNVGGLSNYFSRLMSSRLYTSMREGSKKILSNLPPMLELAKRTEEHMKGMLVPGTLFEELGFTYFGPIDGHDMDELLPMLENIKTIKGPILLHVLTKKGQGYSHAEKDPVNYHAVSPGYYAESKKEPLDNNDSIARTYTEVFSQWICDQANADERLIGITPAMKEGSGLVKFAQQFPTRYFDVAIAEQHAVTFAAGLACEGKKPVVAIYSSFLQRAYDQLIHDVAIQNLPVIFAIDRAGLVGSDGATHSGNFDISFLRCIPNMTIIAPSNANELYHLLNFSYQLNRPVAIRYPRGGHNTKVIEQSSTSPVELGKGVMVKSPQISDSKLKNVAIINFGVFLEFALEAAEQLSESVNISIADMRFVKPLDQQLLLTLAKQNDFLITLEDNTIQGGAGSAVSEFLSREKVVIYSIGLPDEFPQHATQQELYQAYQLDAEGIAQRIKHMLQL